MAQSEVSTRNGTDLAELHVEFDFRHFGPAPRNCLRPLGDYCGVFGGIYHGDDMAGQFVLDDSRDAYRDTG